MIGFENRVKGGGGGLLEKLVVNIVTTNPFKGIKIGRDKLAWEK